MRNHPRRKKRKEKKQPPKHECSGANCQVCEDEWASRQQRWSGKTHNIKMFRIYHV